MLTHHPGLSIEPAVIKEEQYQAAIITSLIISMLLGKRLIRFLHKKQIGETVRDLGLEGQIQKKGTPTMGGLIILSAILIPTLLFAKLHNNFSRKRLSFTLILVKILNNYAFVVFDYIVNDVCCCGCW